MCRVKRGAYGVLAATEDDRFKVDVSMDNPSDPGNKVFFCDLPFSPGKMHCLFSHDMMFI